MMPSVEYRNQVAESLKAIWKRDPTPAEVDTELLAQKHILDREKQVPDIIPGGAERRASGQIAERLLPPAAVQRRVRSDKGSAPLKADLERMPPEMRAAARAAIRVGGSVGSTLGNVISPITAPEDAWFWLLDKAGYKQEYLGPLQNLVHGLKGASETLTATAEEDRQNQGDTGQASTLNDVIEGGLTAYGDINTRFKAIHKLLEAGGVVATPAKVMALAGGVDNMDKGTLATLQGVVDGAIRGRALDAAISKLGVIKGSLATGVGSGVETYATTGDPKKALESAAVMTGLGLGGGGVKEDLNSMRPVGRDVARAESLPVGEMLNASEGIRAGQERAANESARRGLSSIGDQMKAKGQAPLEGQNAEATRPVEQSLGLTRLPIPLKRLQRLRRRIILISSRDTREERSVDNSKKARRKFPTAAQIKVLRELVWERRHLRWLERRIHQARQPSPLELRLRKEADALVEWQMREMCQPPPNLYYRKG
jgi:hypothetical protein